jgi:hypothetical protein
MGTHYRSFDMGLGNRADGIRVNKLSSYRRILPFIMRTRTEASVYLRQDFDMTRTLRYVEDQKAAGRNIRLFHIFLCAVVRTIALRPELNRFIAGRRLYQRKGIWISFIVKKQLQEKAASTNAKIKFEPDETLFTVGERIDRHLRFARGSEKTGDEKEMDFFTRFPRWAVQLVCWAFRALDYWGIAPKGMLRADPLYCSLYVANLGSIGLDAPFHHLYDWGTASFFMVIGKVHKAPVVDSDGRLTVRDTATVNFTMDDRVTDGLYSARAIQLLKSFVEDPRQLEVSLSAEERQVWTAANAP